MLYFANSLITSKTYLKRYSEAVFFHNSLTTAGNRTQVTTSVRLHLSQKTFLRTLYQLSYCSAYYSPYIALKATETYPIFISNHL